MHTRISNVKVQKQKKHISSSHDSCLRSLHSSIIVNRIIASAQNTFDTPTSMGDKAFLTDSDGCVLRKHRGVLLSVWSMVFYAEFTCSVEKQDLTNRIREAELALTDIYLIINYFPNTANLARHLIGVFLGVFLLPR